MEYIEHYLKNRLNVLPVEEELSLFYEIQKDENKYLILPIRGVGKDFRIDGTNIPLTDNYLNLFKNKVIYSGLINEVLLSKCEKYHIKLKTYLTEDLAIKNNYITTEGIIEAIVNHSEKAIFNSRILVIGYGKLGQICANILKSLKANIMVACRHEKDSLHAKINEFETVNYEQMIRFINDFDFIINTVPYRIMNKTLLDAIINQNLLILDVASAPYGLDHDIAKEKGIKTLLLPGIPGKIAPITAGELIGAFIYQDIVGGEA